MTNKDNDIIENDNGIIYVTDSRLVKLTLPFESQSP